MKRIGYLLVIMLIVFWLAIFISANLQEVKVNLFPGKPWGAAPLIVIILGSVLLGVLLAALAGGISQAKLLAKNRKQKKAIKKLEQKVASLKNVPVEEVKEEIRGTEEID